MTPKEAIQTILDDKEKYTTTLNYAVEYCRVALMMDENSHAFKIQCAYILENIRYWRHPKAKEVRATLKKV